jgi:hypothetical protein
MSVYGVFMYHSMARAQVMDGGDGLQIWRVAGITTIKQSRTAKRGWSSIIDFGREAKNPSS